MIWMLMVEDAMEDSGTEILLCEASGIAAEPARALFDLLVNEWPGGRGSTGPWVWEGRIFNGEAAGRWRRPGFVESVRWRVGGRMWPPGTPKKTRAIGSAARVHFSHKALNRKSGEEMMAMLAERSAVKGRTTRVR